MGIASDLTDTWHYTGVILLPRARWGSVPVAKAT